MLLLLCGCFLKYQSVCLSFMAQSIVLRTCWVGHLTYSQFPGQASPLGGWPVPVHILSPVTDEALLESAPGVEWLQKWFHDPPTWKLCWWAGIWTFSTWICSQTHYRLCYGAQQTLINFLPVCMCYLFCLCWGFTAQSIQWGHIERGQFT